MSARLLILVLAHLYFLSNVTLAFPPNYAPLFGYGTNIGSGDDAASFWLLCTSHFCGYVFNFRKILGLKTFKPLFSDVADQFLRYFLHDLHPIIYGTISTSFLFLRKLAVIIISWSSQHFSTLSSTPLHTWTNKKLTPGCCNFVPRKSKEQERIGRHVYGIFPRRSNKPAETFN
jgi:hypothetical protein